MPFSEGDSRRLLVIATGHALSLALGEGGETLAEHHEAIGLGHAEALMPALRAMLAPFGGADARVDGVLVETGPGSFTGLRIGHAAAAALALAWDVPLAGVRSTLLVAAEARAAGVTGALGVALAAPRGQYWIEHFELPSLSSQGAPQALAAPDAASLFAGGQWAGSAVPDAMRAGRAGLPRASLALRLEPGLCEAPTPLYVRADHVHGPG